MARAFIQCNNTFDFTTGEKRLTPINPNVYNAYYGLRELGFECIFFETYEELLEWHHVKSEIICGGIGMIHRRLKDFDINTDEINYPDELNSYLKRDIWYSTINEVRDSPEQWPVFVKSVEGKKLTGKVIASITDLVGCGSCDDNYDVICSNVKDIISEWRVFVRYGKVLDVKPYKGDWTVHYDPEIIKNTINDYTTAPAAYSIDFGVTSEGETILIEVNDGYALGCYGLSYWLYSKFMLSRWAELTDTVDDYWYI